MKKILFFVVLIASFVVICFSFDTGEVSRDVDGDTLKVIINGEERTVRLLGVDTAESVHPAKPVEDGALEASDFTKQLTGKSVILTYDKKKTGYYGRTLAYVWVEVEHGELICWNVELIRQGHSELYKKYKFEGKDWFERRLR